jgi:FkbM family methyltransferase
MNQFKVPVGIRTAAERGSHRFVLRRRLPKPFDNALIYASSEGGLRYLRPSLKNVDPALLALAASVVHAGQVIWDIGANVGLFSLAAAIATGTEGRVLAVEPDATLVRLLRRSAQINGNYAPVDVLPAAVADQITVTQFHVARRNRSTSHLDGFGTTQTGGIRATELVPTVTLDWLARHFGAPDVIKIDVEAAEVGVLAGGSAVLKKLPTIICEVARQNADVVGEMLRKHGYTLFDGDCAEALRVAMPKAPPNTLAIGQKIP